MLSDFELYCAICGGPLSTANCEIADPDSPTYPKIRVWIVNRRLERRPGEDLRKIRRICAEISGRDWYDEEYNSYDPGVISVEDLAWLEDVCILGLDPDGEDGPRYAPWCCVAVRSCMRLICLKVHSCTNLPLRRTG